MEKRIAYITDIHFDESDVIEMGVDARHHLKVILEDVEKRGINEVMIGGDIGEPASLEWFFNSLKTYTTLNITLGNHDTFSEVMQFYKNDLNKGNNELYYSQEDDYLKYLYLDSSSYEMSNKQYQWLLSELQCQKPLIVFIHHPVLSVDTEMDRKYPLKQRAYIEEVLQQHKKSVYVFCGHYHTADEKTVGNITQFVTHAVSFQVVKQFDKIEFNTTTFGYRIIDIKEGTINTKLVTFSQ